MVLTAFHYVVFALFPAAMAFAGASDLFTMTIPNRVSLGLLVLFVVLAPFVGLSLPTFGWHIGAAATVFAAAFACFAFGWVGGGDAKLATVAALWLGIEHLAEFVGLFSIFGGALTLLLLAIRSVPLPVAVTRLPWVARLHDQKTGVPYGIALAAAALAIYPGTVWAELL
ncbi:MAG: prepilin peptidase [Bauldia sp.]